MTTTQENNQSAENHAPACLSPEDVSQEQLIALLLSKKLQSLSKEATEDLMSLVPELVACDSREVFSEIAETVREIIFPELIGGIQHGSAGPVSTTANLEVRMRFVGGKIKEARCAKNWTQDKLAEESNIPQGYISKLESGQHSPNHRTLQRLAAAMGVEVGQLDPSND